MLDWLDSVLWFFEQIEGFFNDIIDWIADCLKGWGYLISQISSGLSQIEVIANMTPTIIAGSIVTFFTLSVVFRIIGR